MTRDQINFMRKVEEEAEYGNPFEPETLEDQELATQCEIRGWVNVEDGEVYLTTPGFEALAMEGR